MAEQHDSAATTEVEELRRRVAELEGRSSRRHMLRLAGAAVVGGVAASAVGAQPAAATTGAMQFGAPNNAGVDATSLTANVATAAFLVSNASVNGISVGVRGNASGDGTGVRGSVSSATAQAYGVWGQIDGGLGYPLVAEGGTAQLFLLPNAGSGMPDSGQHWKGEVVANLGGFYGCVAGTGTTVGTWRTLAAVDSAGAFFPISPARVYDSRKAAPTPGILSTGANRLVSVADKRDTNTGAITVSNVVPAGATAIAFNLTVVNTVGTNGFLAVNEGGNTTVAASLINWSSASLTTANSTVVKINSSRQVTVICGGTSTSCHFIIDVLGYYR